MSHHYSHLQSSIAIIQLYKPGEPFVHFIRKYFALHKKFGSKDRKKISALCYSYFRTKHLLNGQSLSHAIVHACFLCEGEYSALLEDQAPALNQKIQLSLQEKLNFLRLDVQQLFPFEKHLSPSIDCNYFALSFLLQPFLFIRIRPGKHAKVHAALNQEGILFKVDYAQNLVIENGKNMPAVLKHNRDFVVQDTSSQQVFNAAIENGWIDPASKPIRVWDCCAASGGKSILLHDLVHKNIQLTVSDIRKNILHNLQQRFQDAGIALYKTFVADLEVAPSKEVEPSFDVVICDAPCTGSGTWSRTPEQMAFFDESTINTYAEKQLKIATHAALALKKGGLLFYITCSVFEKENEILVKELSRKKNLSILHTTYVKGYQHRADTMFVSILQK